MIRLRFDGRSTEVIKVTYMSVRWPASHSDADLFMYLASSACGRNKYRRMVVEWLNGSRSVTTDLVIFV